MGSERYPHTLPSAFYTDPHHFRRETDEWFLNRWVNVGRADQIPEPGDYFLRDIVGESILVLRGEDGVVRAFYNVCRHRGTQLCEEASGRFKSRIQCPYHAWTYSLDGKLVGAPHMAETPGFSLADHPLNAVACESWDGNLFANLTHSTPRPLAEQLENVLSKIRPWRMEDLRLGKRSVYAVKANWKLIIQNYSECLHCPMIHPALAKLSHYMSGDNEPPQPHFLGGSMELNPGVETLSVNGAMTRAPLPNLDDKQRRHVYYYWMMPNLLLSLHPDYVMTHLLFPKSAALTEVVCEFHFHKDEVAKPGFDGSDAYELWDMTNKQDWKVCELSQLGISSRGYIPGPYSTREGLLHEFDRIVTKDFV